MRKNRHIVLLLAAGKSTRMGGSRPKQYMEIDGESILLHTMLAFQKHPLINDIYVACRPEWEATVIEEAGKGKINKFRGAIYGGDTAFRTICNGIDYIIKRYAPDDMLLVHDAVRPLVSQGIISQSIDVCSAHGNSITALASQEALIVSKDGHASDGFIPRENLYRAQTPHTFHVRTLHQIATAIQTSQISHSQSLFTLANEAGISPLYIAQGEMLNFKITHPADVSLYKALKDTEN